MPDSNTQIPQEAATGLGEAVPKICGADVELGNFVLGMNSPAGTSHLASRMLLSCVHGIPQYASSRWASSQSSWYGGSYTTYGDEFNTAGAWGAPAGAAGSYAQDWGRKFLSTNGGCVYIDLNHLELCIPEVRSAVDFVAAWHAMLRIAQCALSAANASLAQSGRAGAGARSSQGRCIVVLVNNSDGLGNSYGSHLNFLLSRRTWDAIFHRKLHYLAYLASFQVSSIVVTGQGKVGSENGAPAVDYQLSQRADFFETVTGIQTTYRRPLVNSRDEALCGRSYRTYPAQDDPREDAASGLARLHVIFYDSNLCHVACLLKVGMMQILLAMMEEGEVLPELILDDPLDAVLRYSHDPSLAAKARTAGGQHVSAVEHQLRFLETAQRFCARGRCEGIVPGAEQILALQADTLEKLAGGDLDALAGRLDWVLKLRMLQQAMAEYRLAWHSADIKKLDHDYANLDPDSGLYWAYEDGGIVERVVDDARIEHFTRQPPDDTRAWTRTMLLRCAGPDRVQHVDWDGVELQGATRLGWPRYRTVQLTDPARMGRREMEPLFRDNRSLRELLEAITAQGAAWVSETTWTATSTPLLEATPPLCPAACDTGAAGQTSFSTYDCDSWPPAVPKTEDGPDPEGDGQSARPS